MTRPSIDEHGIIGSRPAAVTDLGPLFAVAQRRMLRSPAEYAELAAFSRDGMKLLEVARRIANAILDVQGSVAVWEVRVAMVAKKWLANDGTETLDALGGLGTGMQLMVVDNERPPEWAQVILQHSHGNRNSVWARRKDVGAYSRIERQRRTAA